MSLVLYAQSLPTLGVPSCLGDVAGGGTTALRCTPRRGVDEEDSLGRGTPPRHNQKGATAYKL